MSDELGTCAGKLQTGPSRLVRQIGLGLVIVVGIVIVATLALGAWWGVIDWLRNFGRTELSLPLIDRQATPGQAFRQWPNGTLFGVLEDAINWYNFSFTSGTRFGSGIGIIGGGIAAIMLSERYGLSTRLAAGVVGGGLIGARWALMVTSDVPYFLAGILIGVACGVAACLVNDPRRRLPDLPELDEGCGSSSV